MYKQQNLFASAAFALLLTGCGSKPTQPVAETAKPVETAVPTPAPKVEEPALETKGTHVVTGAIVKVHPKGNGITLRHSSGKTHEIEVDEETNVRGLKHAFQEIGKGTVHLVKATGETMKDGTVATVHYVEKGGKKIGTEIQHASKVTAKATEGVVHKIEEGGKKVIVKSKDGVEHSYEVAKHVTVSSGDKIADFGKFTGGKLKEGGQVTVHFTQEAGHKIAHFFHHKD